MIIHRGTDPIGSWRFSSRHLSPRLTSSRDELEWAVSQLPAVLQVLQDAKLLVPTHVVVRLPETRPARSPARIQSEAASWRDVRAVLDRLAREWPGVEPLDIDIQGAGVITDGTSDRWLRDVAGLEAYGAGLYGGLGVATWCDAWLPFDLRGRPQHDLRARNAPRLTEALQRIEALIGFPADAGDSRFSEADGYTLTNRMDMDGEPVDLSMLGYDDSCIAVDSEPATGAASSVSPVPEREQPSTPPPLSTNIPDGLRERWAAVFAAAPHSCVDVAGACPACGEAQLHRHYLFGRSIARVIDGQHYTSEGTVWEWCSGCRTYEKRAALVPLWWSYYTHVELEPGVVPTLDVLEAAVQKRRRDFREARQLQVVELRSFDGTTEGLLARFVLTRAAEVVTVARTEHDREVADRRVARVPGPSSTWLTRDDGLAFLEQLPANLSGSRVHATKVFEMDETAALTAPS